MDKLVEKVDNHEYVVRMVYKMLNSKDLGVNMDEIMVPIRPKEARVEHSGKDREEVGVDTTQSPFIDPHSTSSSATPRRVDDICATIVSVVRDLNVSLDPILEEQIT